MLKMNKVPLIFIILNLTVIHSFGFRRQKEYCSLMAKCHLEYSKETCPDSLITGAKKVKYTPEKCTELKDLITNGIDPNDPTGHLLIGFMGQRYRVDYQIKDSLSIDQKSFEYLLDNIPLAANVVNTFQETEYWAEYLDGDRKKYWKGNNGGNLSGEAELIGGGIPTKNLTYFGFGVVKVMRWKLRGRVLFSYKYYISPSHKINYHLHVIVFPGGSFVNAIMNMGLFKRVVRNKIKDVFMDITHSAEDLKKTSYEDILKKRKWTDKEKEWLKELKSFK